jgi:hypothetical protein
MHQKLVFENGNVDKVYLTNHGGFNSFPEPYEETDPNNLYDALATDTIAEIEFRQIEIDGIFCNVRIFYFYETAYGFVYDWQNKKVRVFHIGCKHSYKETSLGMCLHKYECTKCGYAKTVDTSD